MDDDKRREDGMTQRRKVLGHEWVDKSVKNRIHFDIEPVEGTRDEELARLLAHGAVEVSDHRGQYGPGTGWVTLADPEGNEFCILRSPAEHGRGVPAPAES